MPEKPSRVRSPFTGETISKLRIGTPVLISGVVFVGRDAAHRRIVEALDKGQTPPFSIDGQTVYYMGPSPARPGQVIGSAGPTTSSRMDAFTPRLLQAGLKAMIGKGERSAAVRQAIVKHRAIYLVATGGAAALITKSITKCDVVAYAELGAEALLRIEVEDFPAIVANDIYGGDLFEQAKAKYRREG